MLYAKQVNPAYQESPLYLFEDFPEHLAVCGNREFNEHLPGVFKRVREVLEAGELAEALEDIKNKNGYWLSWYTSATAAINDLLPPEKARYTTRDIHELKRLIPMYGNYTGDDQTICDILSIVTGEKWKYKTIRGYCQGDWNTVFYPVDHWDANALKCFEIEYFNMGSEWVVHEGKEAPETPDDISGCAVYCYSYDIESIKKELAEAIGEKNAESAVLWEYAGSTERPIYRKVG